MTTKVIAEKRIPELLAPAGDTESLAAALRYGADAVYIGGPFMQLRSAKAAFDEQAVADAAAMCRAAGKRLYVTVNCFAKNEELPRLAPYARFLAEAGVSAAIVSDPGAISVMREAAPGLELHLSTQANCTNWASARLWHSLGVRRVVLARELSIDEIAEIRRNVPEGLELEAFIHGAMCMAYSGRCLISAYLTGRSGNRGECTQPCRWTYRLVEEKRPGEYFPVIEGDDGSAILSSQDMCCAEILPRLAAAGVTSFKIEGRMKTAYYVATVVNAYRALLDGKLSPQQALAELDCASHRQRSTGFYLGPAPQCQPDGPQEYEQDCIFTANVLGYKDGRLLVRQRNRFCTGDRLECLTPGRFGLAFTAQDMRLEDGTRVDVANHPNMILSMDCPVELSAGDMLRVRKK